MKLNNFKINALLISIFILIIAGACKTGQVKDGAKEGDCIEGNCKDGTGTMVWSKGYKYIGEFKDGKRHGKNAKFYWPDGFNTVSDWHEDTNTSVVAKWGKCIEGNCKDGKATILMPDFSNYKGDFSNSIPNGKGKYISNGTVYVGDVKDDMFHGMGKVMYYKKGRLHKKITGYYKNGKIWWGRVRWADGSLGGSYTNGKFKEKNKNKSNRDTSIKTKLFAEYSQYPKPTIKQIENFLNSTYISELRSACKSPPNFKVSDKNRGVRISRFPCYNLKTKKNGWHYGGSIPMTCKKNLDNKGQIRIGGVYLFWDYRFNFAKKTKYLKCK